MASTNLVPTGFNSNTGWVGTATDMATSNDTRVTAGVVGDTFDVALTDLTEAESVSLTLNVEARTVGSINRTKQIVIELFNSTNVLQETFTTTDIAATDTVYSSGTLSSTVGDLAATINGWYLRVSLTEGGGMPDTASVEIDHLYVVLEFNIPAKTVTDSFLDDSADTFFAETIVPGPVTVTDSYLDDSADTHYSETVLGLNSIVDSYLDDSADTLYPETLTLAELTRRYIIS